MKEVQIENRPALDLIRRFNFDSVLIYADPPYLLDTRGGKARNGTRPTRKYEIFEDEEVDIDG